MSSPAVALPNATAPNRFTRDLRIASTRRPAAPTKKGLFARILEAVVEARLRQAERQIRAHLGVIPPSVLADAGIRATHGAKKLPFVR